MRRSCSKYLKRPSIRQTSLRMMEKASWRKTITPMLQIPYPMIFHCLHRIRRLNLMTRCEELNGRVSRGIFRQGPIPQLLLPLNGLQLLLGIFPIRYMVHPASQTRVRCPAGFINIRAPHKCRCHHALSFKHLPKALPIKLKGVIHRPMICPWM